MERWRSERQKAWGNSERGRGALGDAEVHRLNAATGGEKLVPRVVKAPAVVVEAIKAPAISKN